MLMTGESQSYNSELGMLYLSLFLTFCYIWNTIREPTFNILWQQESAIWNYVYA